MQRLKFNCSIDLHNVTLAVLHTIYRENNGDKEPHHYKNMKPLNMSFVLVHSCVFSVNIGCRFHQ